MTKENPYIIVEKALEKHRQLIIAAITAVLDNEVSKYPIIILHQGTANFGIPIINEDQNLEDWTVNISSLEEFATKQLIQMEKVEDFVSLYKAHEAHFCFFYISDVQGQFVFIKK